MTVYSRSAERREAFAKRVSDEVGIEAVAVDTVDAAVADADVIVTATNSPEPVLMRGHLQPGQHIVAIGIRSEIEPAAIAACHVFGDGREEALHDGKFSVAVAAGAVTAEELGPELGEVLDGRARGREDDTQITMFDSSGVAIQDVVCARHAWESAVRLGLGTVVSFDGASVLA